MPITIPDVDIDELEGTQYTIYLDPTAGIRLHDDEPGLRRWVHILDVPDRAVAKSVQSALIAHVDELSSLADRYRDGQWDDGTDELADDVGQRILEGITYYRDAAEWLRGDEHILRGLLDSYVDGIVAGIVADALDSSPPVYLDPDDVWAAVVHILCAWGVGCRRYRHGAVTHGVTAPTTSPPPLPPWNQSHYPIPRARS